VLDGEELTLRLHDLFRDFLEERLRRTHPDQMPALLRLTAQGETDPVRRTLMFLRAGAWDDAQQSLADATPVMLAGDNGAQVLRIIEQFPADIQECSPLLAYVRGLCAWPRYQYGTVRPLMSHAAAIFDAQGRHDDAQRARAMQALALLFCGRLEDARCLSDAVRARPMDLETETLSELLDFWYEGHHGPIDGPGKHLAKVVDLLARGGSAELWFRCMPRVNMFSSRPGVSAQIQRMVQGAKEATGDGHWSLQSNANLMEAWLHLWQGRIAELETALQGIEEDSRWLGQPAGLRLRLLTLKVNHQLICDDRDAVRETRDTMAAHASFLDQSSDLPLQYLSIVVRASAAVGDWAAVRTHLPVLKLQTGHESPCMRMFMRSVEAQLALEEGRCVEDARAALRELATKSAEFDTMFLDAVVRTWLARAELAAGSPTAAWRALEPLIENVLASGNVGQILGSGVQSQTELSRAPWGSAASKRGLAALRMWVDTARQLKAGSHEKPLALAPQDAGLSVRELEVLALLGQGQSNKLIARALNLSPHTVKRHVARILDRLDLSSRMQAADWYRAFEMQGKKT
jgi:LuxR family maltose regulon positive regulatory protein